MKYSLADIWHRRSKPHLHEFSYNTLYWIIDVDQAVGKVKRGLFSFNPEDYLSKQELSLRDKFQTVLQDYGIDDRPDKVYLHTVPRFMGAVFNPASFYIGEGEDRNVFILEINNTFGEKHSYASTWDKPEETLEVRVPKVFHVSPFNPLKDEYIVKVKPMGDSYYASVDIINEEGMFFESTIKWEPQAWKNGFLNSLIYSLKYGFGILMTTSRIGWHAAILYFKHKMKTFDLPNPPDKRTVQWGKPVLLQRLLTGEWLEKLSK